MSRYIVEEREDGSRISGRPHPIDMPGQPEALVEMAYDWSGLRREPVEVIRRRLWLEVHSAGSSWRIPFCNLRQLVDGIARSLMGPWSVPLAAAAPTDTPEYKLRWLRDWAVGRTAYAICKRVHAQWQRLLAGVDPDVLAVNRRVFSACFRWPLPPALWEEDLHRHTYFVKDILAIRAAAVATLECGVSSEPGCAGRPMDQWRPAYVPQYGPPYRILNKTFAAVPGGVPAGLLLDLGRFVLPRPLRTRLELLATLLAVSSESEGLELKFRAVAFDDVDQTQRSVSQSVWSNARPDETMAVTDEKDRRPNLWPPPAGRTD